MFWSVLYWKCIINFISFLMLHYKVYTVYVFFFIGFDCTVLFFNKALFILVSPLFIFEMQMHLCLNIILAQKMYKTLYL